MSASSQGLGGRLVYFDHAATSWPKAAGVAEAVAAALCDPIGNPGRSGHRASIAAARLVLDTRERLAELLGVHDPSRLIFTKNATEALNLAILGSLEPGDHAVTTSMEHNSVMRPLRDLQQRGVDLTVVQCARDGTLAVADLQRVLRPATKLVVTTHASNVTGTLMPVADIAAMCRDAGVAYLVDAAQTAGAVPIDVAELAIDLLAAPGHKGLLGPTGTGLLYVREGIDLNPLLRGGTGSLSDQEVQPDFLPDALESGTLNVAGLAGLGAAAKAVAASGVDSVHEHEQAVLRAFVMGARAIPALRLCGPCGRSVRPARCRSTSMA